MLCLSCLLHEGIVCTEKSTGKSFRLVINRINPSQVRLGFEDPEHNFNFRRDEVPDRSSEARDDV